jgi:hypothetical protein
MTAQLYSYEQGDFQELLLQNMYRPGKRDGSATLSDDGSLHLANIKARTIEDAAGIGQAIVSAQAKDYNLGLDFTKRILVSNGDSDFTQKQVKNISGGFPSQIATSLKDFKGVIRVSGQGRILWSTAGPPTIFLSHSNTGLIPSSIMVHRSYWSGSGMGHDVLGGSNIINREGMAIGLCDWNAGPAANWFAFAATILPGDGLQRHCLSLYTNYDSTTNGNLYMTGTCISSWPQGDPTIDRLYLRTNLDAYTSIEAMRVTTEVA